MTYRFLIMNENFLGHQTVHKLLCEQLARNEDVVFDTIELDTVHSFRDRLHRYIASLRFLPGKFLQKQNLDLHRLRFQWYVATVARERVLEKLSQHTYHAIHFHSQPAALRCRDIIAHTPTLISTDLTNAQAAKEWNHPATRWTYWPNQWMEGVVFKEAKRIATFSEWARQSVLKEHPKLAAECVLHLPPGADLAPFSGVSIQRPQKQKLQILFVGGDFPRKGGYELLKIFEQFFQETCELHLVTSWPLVNLPSGVFVYPNIKPYSDELIARYKEADVFVLPTQNEAYGHVFAEAMAAGLPVIATHINAIPEIVPDAEAGLLIAPGDPLALKEALETLLSHAEKRQKMGEAGRLQAMTEFDTRVCYQRYVDTLKAISQLPEA